MSPAPVNYTTKIPASKTVAEIQETLARYGARRIAVEYDDDGMLVGLAFTLQTSVGMRMFDIPANVDRMHRVLIRLGEEGKLRSLSRAEWQSPEHAARIAWRVLKDWIAAQLALIDTGMVDLEVVMLPYLKIDDHRTLYQAWSAGERLALEGPTP